jgi:hypothetical protein
MTLLGFKTILYKKSPVGPAKIQRIQQKIPMSSKMKTNFKKSEGF